MIFWTCEKIGGHVNLTWSHVRRTCRNVSLFLSLKRVDPNFCAADTHGKVRASTVFVSYSLQVSIVGFLTLRQKRIRGGVHSLKVTACHLHNTGCCYEYTIVSVPCMARRDTILSVGAVIFRFKKSNFPFQKKLNSVSIPFHYWQRWIRWNHNISKVSAVNGPSKWHN